MKVYVATVFGDGQVSDYHGVGQSPYNGILYTEEEKNKIEAAINAQNATRGIEWHEIECDEQFLKDHKTLSLLIRGYRAESYGSAEYIADFKLYTPEQIEEMKQQGTMLEDGEYLTSWDYESPLYQEKTNTIDIEQLAINLGKEPTTLSNGRKVISWKQEELKAAVNAVKDLADEGKTVIITGGAPGWLVTALTHAVHPCEVKLYDPKLVKDGSDGLISIPKVIPVGEIDSQGEINPEAEVKFKVQEGKETILIEWEIAHESGIYDENNLKNVAVPKVSPGKDVFISGRGPNYLTVTIAMAYAHTNRSVSLNQPHVGYTCAITHSRSKNLGDLINDPLLQEKIKEQLAASKEGQALEQIPDKEVKSQEGPAIDD